MNLQTVGRFLCLGLGLAVGIFAGRGALAEPSAVDTAKQVDQLLAEEVFQGKSESELAARIDGSGDAALRALSAGACAAHYAVYAHAGFPA